jgi:hypothetical protein
MKRVLALACCLGLLACRRSPAPVAAAPPPADPKVIADWNGGSASLSDVEGALLAMTSTERLSREGDIVKTYREVAEERAAAQVLLPKGPGGAVVGLETSAPELYQRTLVQLYSRDVALRGRDLAVGEDEVKAFYRDHPRQFRRPPRVLLFNIYKRKAAGEDSKEAVAFLADLRKRVQAGERFADLARAHSDSETRANDGQVGWTERGTMAPALDRVAFALKEGEVSQPVAVPSGAVLLYAEKAVPEKTFAYEDVKIEIHRQLERRKLHDVLEAWAKDVPIPEGSMVLTREELKTALASGKDADPVLRVSGVTVTRADFTKALPPQARGRLPEPQAWELYRQRLWQLLLLSEARRSGYADRPETKEQLDRILRRSLERKAVEDKLEARLQGDLKPADAALRAYYDDHPQRFMTPLKLRLRVLILDKVASFNARMLELESARAEMVAGKLTLDEAAKRLGGRVEDIGWRDAMQLQGLGDKERRYVLDLQSAGYTVPFQHEGSLRVIQVVERQEPARRPYEQVKAEVLSTYLQEKRKELLDAAMKRILEEARFRFFEDRVRTALAVTTPKAPASPAK